MEANQLTQVAQGYMEAMLWAETDSEGEFYDQRFSPGDIADSSAAAIDADIRAFMEEAETLGLIHMEGSLWWINQDDPQPEHLDRLGHDIHLTRQHHGTGFWDRGWGAEGDRLTEIAHKLGEVTVWAEDGRVHMERG